MPEGCHVLQALCPTRSRVVSRRFGLSDDVVTMAARRSIASVAQAMRLKLQRS
jgi:hypothetical protein